MMQKFLKIIKHVGFAIAVLCLAWPAFAQSQENYDNPGYFETPGFLALSASFSPRNRSAMNRDNTPAPYLWGVYNIVQSEYGNIGLLAGVQYTRPSRDYADFEMKSDFVTGDLGLGYFTAAKTMNFFIGAGYSTSWLKLRQYANTGGKISYTEHPYGFFYFVGFEYGLTKDGKWGIFIILNGREMKNTEFEYDDGKGFAGESFINVSNQVVSVGIAHHF
ncbi:MAG: hypothetical protein LBV04_00475 [Deferribacteraceae bacterium]|jgi:hypothetical protein|nr:hypothetical protein [Deferribacteraceae bacterium]